MGEKYSRPASGYRFANGGMKTNSPADGLPEGKYAILQNVRGTDDNSLQSRPPITQSQQPPASGSGPVLSLEPTLGVYKIAGGLFYANGTGPATPLDTGYDPTHGASIIPFRPNASPNAWDYVFDGNKQTKVNVSGTPVVNKVGIAEAQAPNGAALSGVRYSFMGPPTGGPPFKNVSNAGAISVGNRITDKVAAVFHDSVNFGLVTVQVTAGSSIAAGVYLYSPVTAYFFKLTSPQGAYRGVYPVDTGTADAAASGNSLLFNPPQYNGTEDPNVQPLHWATLTGSTNTISGYTTPYPADTNFSYYMVVLTQLFVPVAGNYTININHDDGMIFAIAGASLVSGPVTDPYAHTQTAVNGYKFTNGTIAGVNGQGYHKDTYVVNFPAPGTYGLEIDYAQFKDNQCLNVYLNSAIITNTSANQNYQRGMVVKNTTAGQYLVVEDVYPALPQSLGIAGIYYFSGNTGQCVVVPQSLTSGPGTEGESLNAETYLSSLRRGALVQIGTEVCLVQNTSLGPDGNICFETSTVGTHTAAEQIFGIPAILAFGTPSPGDVLASADITFSVTTGIGTATLALTQNPFVNANFSFQEEDYIHFSVNVDSLANLNELKFLIDVGDGSFTQNFYYFTVRPSDIAAGVSNTLTQLGVAQLVSQQATIDEEKAATAKNQGVTSSSAQTVPGSLQWSEILFSISQMTRVGNDQTKTLQNANAMQILVNCGGTVAIGFNSATVSGGFSPDVGATGIPYMYWRRGRSSVTGALANPCPIMRYGVNPRREQVIIDLGGIPDSSYDSQIDTEDIFRQGGALSKILYIGSVPIPSRYFYDVYSDDAIAANDEMERSNFEPFPTIGDPITATSATIVGTVAIATFTLLPLGTLGQIGSLLPGNIVNVGQQVFTLWNRPTFVSAAGNFQTWMFRFEENAGVLTNPFFNIKEPALANQTHPYVFGPDSNGVLFSVGDPFRAGVVSRTNPQNPDSSDEGNADELCAPTEPLQGGEILGDIPVVASSKRWWAGYPQQNAVVPYRWTGIPVGRGLAAPFGICSNGKSIFFCAEDGIYRHSLGASQSLTGEDLYNLFPHEGFLFQQPFTYGGQTVYPPDYKYAASFRLCVANDFLFFDYQDTNAVQRTLVCDLKTMAWSVDTYTPSVTIHATPTTPAATSKVFFPHLGPTPIALQQLFMGDTNGGIDIELSTGGTEAVPMVVATREETMGDLRAQKQFGDAYLDLLPAGGNVTITPMMQGVPFGTSTAVPGAQVARTSAVVNLLGEQLTKSLGLLVTATDVGAQTKLYSWQPSYVVKPEDTQNRFGDYDNAGSDGAKFFQGFLLDADTNNLPKNLTIRNSDTGVAQQTFTITHNGQQEKAYSFTVPFVAHLVREEPDLVPWKKYKLTWITQPTPEVVRNWITQPTAHGMLGFQHVKECRLAYSAPQPVQFQITIDGVNYPYTIPPTLGFTRITIPFGPWKGRVFQYSATSTAGFQLWVEDLSLMVKAWGDAGPYKEVKLLGSSMGPLATI